MTKKLNRQLGKQAEDLAATHLKQKGYRILERNFANRFGEIDIIAKDKNILVFVEVKAKTKTNFGLPEEMINPKKMAKIRQVSLTYLQGKTLPLRLDVIAVVFGVKQQVIRLTHYENVY